MVEKECCGSKLIAKFYLQDEWSYIYLISKNTKYLRSSYLIYYITVWLYNHK